MNTLPDNFQELRLVYEQVSKQHRYFLSWRQYLLAGYFVVFSSISFAAYSLYIKGNLDEAKFIIDGKELAAWLFLALSVISFVFFRLEKRNTELYQICQELGMDIEDKFGINSKFQMNGLFKCLNLLTEFRSGVDFYSHTEILRVIYLGGLVLSFLFSVVICLNLGSCSCYYLVWVIFLLFILVIAFLPDRPPAESTKSTIYVEINKSNHSKPKRN